MSNQIYIGKRNLLGSAAANVAGIWRQEDIFQLRSNFFIGGPPPPLYTMDISVPITFTPGGSTGRTGPSLAQARTGLTGTGTDNWKNDTNYLNTDGNGIILWTAPTAGVYQIDAYGAKGGTSNQGGGLGARIRGEFNLIRGEVLRILVGQLGLNASSCGGGSGGGGTFVVRASSNNTSDICTIAGGGAGGGTASGGVSGTTSQAGTTDSSGNFAGGSSGNGGSQGSGAPCGIQYSSGGGGGFLTNGGGPAGAMGVTNTGGGFAFIYGGFGGDRTRGTNGSTFVDGGFGGGGMGNYGAGGGGGYGGGGAGLGAACDCSTWYGGGGGGSFNNGTNPLNTGAANNGDGYVIITRLS